MMYSPSRGALTAAVAAMFAASAYAGPAVLTAVQLAAALALAWGLPYLLHTSAPRGSLLVVGLVAVGATAGMYWIPEDALVLPLAVAFGVVAAFLQQMFRGDSRPGMIESVSGTVVGVILVVSGSGWVGALAIPNGLGAILITVAAVAVAAAVTLLRLSALATVGIATAGATLLATVLGFLMSGAQLGLVAALGLAAGSIVSATHVLFLRRQPVASISAPIAAAVLPVLALGLPVMQIARIAG